MLKGKTLKIANAVKKSKAVKKSDSHISCATYKVDLHAKTGYGVCVHCGKSQAEHKVKRVNADLADADEEEAGLTTTDRGAPKMRRSVVMEQDTVCGSCALM